ncbi:MAG: CDP-diacylglycerol--glycerol-3-phosphate 3-phosphatidyltransferase [Candidatus Kapabacteria bacterium]|nr:CDP-diacylglycerol--glycerol-3-phosphate 3-phosphatidyltransferase [Candidatus Kapabacteria bacterium]
MNYINRPNIVTFSRVVISPFFFFLFVSNEPVSQMIAAVLFCFGAVTDYIDGWVARKYNEETEAGKFFDPLADKFLTTAAFLAFVKMDIIPLWMVMFILIRDFGTTLLRLYADSTDHPIVTSYSAKVKTFLQMAFIVIILILVFFKNIFSASNLSSIFANLIHSNIIYYSMLLLTLITIWTAIDYLITNKSLFHQIRTQGYYDILCLSISTVFGVGYVPKANGTFGTMAALIILLFPYSVRLEAIWMMFLFTLIISFPAIKRVEAIYGDDSSIIVVDELLGMWLVLASPYVPHTIMTVIIGFTLFRIFDIFKPFPISWFNGRKGSFYVIFDDILSAIFASICLHIIYAGFRVLNIFMI